MSVSEPIALILLAAGSSTRMGEPKQLLLYKNQTLLRRAAEQAVKSGCDPIIVVLGSNAEQMKSELTNLPVQTIENPHWSRGIGTSIRAALSIIFPSPGTPGEGQGEGAFPSTHEECKSAASNAEPVEGFPPSAVIITLCDQPLIDSTALTQLINLHRTTNRPIIAAQYAGTLGVPALFAQKYFPALSTLPDESGAKQLLLKHAADVLPVPMELAAIDIDTPSDYQRLT